jgi:hypothetical protein
MCMAAGKLLLAPKTPSTPNCDQAGVNTMLEILITEVRLCREEQFVCNQEMKSLLNEHTLMLQYLHEKDAAPKVVMHHACT